MKVNINSFVLCRLTDHGIHQITRSGFEPTFHDDGTLEIQLWELMSELGDSIHNGAEQCIYKNIIEFAD